MAQGKSHFSDGAAYERFMGRWTREVGAAFVDWVAPPAGARWIDIGCGTGVFTEVVLSSCSPATVIAVDTSEPQIKVASGKSIAQRVEFRVADSQALPFPDADFDVVVSALVINFIPDPAKALSEMRRVCRPGGRVAGYVWDFAEERSPNSPVRMGLSRVGAKPAPVPGSDYCRCDALRALFARSGLKDVETRTIDVTISYPDFDDFWQCQTPSYGASAKLIATLSKHERGKLIESVRASLPIGRDGSFTCSARANAIKARTPH